MSHELMSSIPQLFEAQDHVDLYQDYNYNFAISLVRKIGERAHDVGTAYYFTACESHVMVLRNPLRVTKRNII
jgi:hypothetical protein